jgi:SpoVK/Ycf46/Vps4 family AAA+-type ATPase
MINHARFENSSITNKAVLTIEPYKSESDRNREQEVSEVSKRFLHSAALLPEREFLGWQIEAERDNIHCFAFSSSGIKVTEKDFNWIFRKCAAADLKPSFESKSLFENNRKVYVLSSVPDRSRDVSDIREKEVEDDFLSDYDDRDMTSYDYFKDMFDMLVEEGAIIQFVAGTADNDSPGRSFLLISLPEEMTLRMRTSISLAFPHLSATELNENPDVAPKMGCFPDEELLESMTRFLFALILRGKEVETEKPQDEIVMGGTELVDDERDEETFEDRNTKYTPIEKLELSVISYNCLKRAGILSLEQLRNMTDEELRHVRNLGKKSFEEIKQILAENQVIPRAVPLTAKTYMDMLNEMIGLEEVKAQIRKITSYAKMKKDMLASGNNPLPIALNMEFVGNPGTAKTTVARIVAGIFYESGLLSENGLIEVGRADLVATYEGQTAGKVKDVFQKAAGKVLFIDEAYSLVENWEGTYGDEAISSIVQEMENNRDDTIVIFAGYPDKMEGFFARNPGLRSRVPFSITFKDYSAAEMLQIVELEAQKRSFSIEPQAKEKVLSICESAMASAESGNGRFSRNLVENAILGYASRVYGNEKKDTAAYCELIAEDFEIPRKTRVKKNHSMGFRTYPA